MGTVLSPKDNSSSYQGTHKLHVEHHTSRDGSERLGFGQLLLNQ